MKSTVEDLAEVSRASIIGRDTRDVAWALLKRLASEGDHEARLAVEELRRAKRQKKARATATIADAMQIKSKHRR